MAYAAPRINRFSSSKLIFEGLFAGLMGTILALFAAQGVTFDGTISLGSLVTTGALVLAVAGAAWANGKKIALGLAKIEDIEKDLSHLSEKVEQFPVVVQQLVDGKARMDDHEARLRALERGRGAT